MQPPARCTKRVATWLFRASGTSSSSIARSELAGEHAEREQSSAHAEADPGGPQRAEVDGDSRSDDGYRQAEVEDDEEARGRLAATLGRCPLGDRSEARTDDDSLAESCDRGAREEGRKRVGCEREREQAHAGGQHAAACGERVRKRNSEQLTRDGHEKKDEHEKPRERRAVMAETEPEELRRNGAEDTGNRERGQTGE